MSRVKKSRPTSAKTPNVKKTQNSYIPNGNGIETTSNQVKPVEDNLPIIERNLEEIVEVSEKDTPTEEAASNSAENECNGVINSNDCVGHNNEPIPKQLSE